MAVASWCSLCFLCCSVCWFLYGPFATAPLNLTYLHCLQHSFFEHLFNVYYFFRPLAYAGKARESFITVGNSFKVVKPPGRISLSGVLF